LVALSGAPLWPSGAQSDDCFQAEHANAVLMRRLGDEWPLRGAADPVSDYVNDLGRRLLQGSEGSAGKRWRFDVARNLSANAFAVGNGYVVVTDGLVAGAPNESYLAAVLAHEMGHVLAGHFCRRHGGGDDFRIGTLVQHYDAQAEEEADARAAGILRRAGFDPGAMAVVLRCLAAGSPSFHAQLDRRLQTLQGLGFGAASARTRRDSAGFEQARRAVKEDFQGLDVGLHGAGGAQPCR
jgi:beta-barrel assembly-enhancing protease